MWTGCIVFLLVFACAFAFEWVWLPQAAEMHRWQYSAVLALLVTFGASNLWGLWHALARIRLTGRSPSQWREGDRVAVSGEVRPVRQALRGPASGRDAVLYEFHVTRAFSSGGKQQTKNEPELLSLGMAPWGILTEGGTVRVLGFPELRAFRRQMPRGETEMRRAVDYMTKHRWVRQPGLLREAVRKINGLPQTAYASQEIFHAGYDSVVLVEYANDGGAEAPEPDPARAGQLAAKLFPDLQSGRLAVAETVVEPGATVTAFGVYRADLIGVEVGSSLPDVDRGLFPGPAGRVVGRLVLRAFLTLVVVTALAVGAHLGAAMDDGAWLREISRVISGT